MASQYRRRSLMLNTIPKVAQGNPTIITDSSSRRIQKLNIYGQSEQRSTNGKNLLNPTGATKVGWNIELPNFRLEVGKQYTYTAPILEGSKACGLYVKASDTQLAPYKQSGKTHTFTVPEETDFSQGILLAGGSGDALTLGDELTAMVELGSVATEFEPYTGGKPSPSPDYPQEIISKEVSSIIVSNGASESQTITLAEPITLRGIPVTLVDGNIVIDGEQYISDCIKEKDGIIGVERNLNELLVSSLGGAKLNQGAHTNGQNYLSCSVGNAYRLTVPLSNRYRGTQFTMNDKCVYISSPAQFIITDSRFTDKETAISIITEEQTKVVYVMNEPSFEPLPEEIQAQYKALKSYYPNTVIQTGCWNEVTYSAKRGG